MKTETYSFGHILLFSALSIVFALAALSLGDHYLLRYPGHAYSIGIQFPLLHRIFIGISLICAFPVLRAFVRQLATMNLLPSSIARRILADDAVRPSFSSTIIPPRVLLAGMLFVCGISILLLTMFMQRSGIVDDDNLDGQLYEITSLIRGTKIRTEELSHVVRVTFLTSTSDASAYLGEAYEVVKTFKEAGAKAVVLPLIEPPVLSKEFPIAQLRRLDSLGVVVFGMTGSVLRWSASGASRSVGTYEIADMEHWPPQLFSRFSLFQTPGMYLPWNKTDILVPLVLKYRGSNDVELVEERDGHLIVGDDRIPLVSDKMFYSKNRYAVHSPVDFMVSREHPWKMYETVSTTKRSGYAQLHNRQSTIALRVTPLYARPVREGEPPPYLTSDQLNNAVAGKIVLLSSNIGRSMIDQAMLTSYGSAFENIVTREFLTKPAYGAFWFTMSVLVLAMIFAFFFRPLLAVVCILALSLISIYAGLVLYDRFDILVDMFYPLLGSGIASFALPLIKFAIMTARPMGPG